MAWLVQGYRDYKAGGSRLVIPEDVQLSTKELIKEICQSPLEMWFRDCVEIVPIQEQLGKKAPWTSMQSLHENYTKFLNANKLHEQAEINRMESKRALALFLQSKNIQHDERSISGYLGIEI